MITWRSRVDHYLQFLVQTCGVAVAPIDRFWHHIFFDIMQSYSTPLTSGYHNIAISAPSRHQHHHHLGPSQELPNGVTHLWLKLRQGHSITTNPPSLSSKVKAMTPQIGVTQIRLKRESITIIKLRVFIIVLLNYDSSDRSHAPCSKGRVIINNHPSSWSLTIYMYATHDSSGGVTRPWRRRRGRDTPGWPTFSDLRWIPPLWKNKRIKDEEKTHALFCWESKAEKNQKFKRSAISEDRHM